MCQISGSKQAKLTSYSAGSNPLTISGLDADTGGTVSVTFTASQDCHGWAFGTRRIFVLEPGDFQQIKDAIDAGSAVEFWGVKVGSVINNASQLEAP